jgi:PHO85 cyclin-1
MPCTRHRMFLATMIVAAKYLNDSSPRNVHWAKHAAYFELSEINLMEKQLLHLLDYDLRFEEKEACMQFAQFLPTISPQERRAAAVSVVTKASQARAQAQMPPTPPHDVVIPETPTILRGPTEHTSSAFLCVPPSETRHSRSSRSCSSDSTPSIDSCNSDVSEMSSLIEDTGSPVSSDTSCDHQERVFDIKQAASRTFNLMPVPARAYRQGRIPLTSTATFDGTISEIKIRPCSDISPSPSPVRLVALETFKSSSRLCTAPKNSGSYIAYDPRSLSSSAFSSADQPRDVSWSSSLPSMTRKSSFSGVGFLSRMWGAATRGAQDKSEKTDVFPIGVAEPDTQYGQTSSAFRRLVHSRSALFRGGAQAEYNV